jgi:hypothetical protein
MFFEIWLLGIVCSTFSLFVTNFQRNRRKTVGLKIEHVHLGIAKSMIDDMDFIWVPK